MCTIQALFSSDQKAQTAGNRPRIKLAMIILFCVKPMQILEISYTGKPAAFLVESPDTLQQFLT
ncbi:MAG: hypothetical protein DU481_11120 [Nitrosomonas sp.]